MSNEPADKSTSTADSPGSWWVSPRALIRSLLQVDDTPHSIALGSAIGMWISLTPTGGIQMALVMLVAFLTAPFFRWNRLAAILMTYVSNPITAIPIFWISYQVGRLFVGGDVTFEDLKRIVTPTTETSFWEQFKQFCYLLGKPFLIGNLVFATVSAVATYPAVLWFLRKFRDPMMSFGPAAGSGEPSERPNDASPAPAEPHLASGTLPSASLLSSNSGIRSSA